MPGEVKPSKLPSQRDRDASENMSSRAGRSATGSFGEQTLEIEAEVAGQRWLRAEVWDIATNGAFTQPVWLDLPPGSILEVEGREWIVGLTRPFRMSRKQKTGRTIPAFPLQPILIRGGLPKVTRPV